jgi:VanZ family protein
MNKFFKYWLPALVWAGVIFWLSSVPDLESGLEQDFILRKIAHILEYAILTFLFLRALAKENLSIGKIVISSIVFSLFYALTDEYHQAFVFGRESSLKDVGIDSVGIILTSILWYTKHRKLKGR